jgi:hypothetical protein
MSARADVRLVAGTAVGAEDDAPPPRTFRDAIRDQLDSLYVRLARPTEAHLATPSRAALDLHADGLDDMHQELLGVIGETAAPLHSAGDWSEILRAEKGGPLVTLARLATHPCREPRRAALAYVRRIATRLGYRLEPMSGGGAELLRDVAQQQRAVAAVGAGLMEDLADDNRVDSREAARRLPEARRAHEASAQVLASLEQLAARNDSEDGR